MLCVLCVRTIAARWRSGVCIARCRQGVAECSVLQLTTTHTHTHTHNFCEGWQTPTAQTHLEVCGARSTRDTTCAAGRRAGVNTFEYIAAYASARLLWRTSMHYLPNACVCVCVCVCVCACACACVRVSVWACGHGRVHALSAERVGAWLLWGRRT